MCPSAFRSRPVRPFGRAGQIQFNALHRLEVPNAFGLLVGRELMTRDQCQAVLAQLQDDLENERLASVSIDLDRVFTNATELSRLHTAKFFSRSLDLLHVSAAHVAQCITFVSADDRQLAVAKASGLRTVNVKRRTLRG